MKIYKLYFENGKVLLLEADHVKYSHDENLNTNMYILYDSNNNVIGAFDMSKMLGDITMRYNDEENTENTEKEIKCIGFRAPEEVTEPEIKKKVEPKKKPAPKKKKGK